jgi:hypothetical protein
MGRKGKITKDGRTRITKAYWRGHSLGYRYMLIVFNKNPQKIFHEYCWAKDVRRAIKSYEACGGIFEIYDLTTPLNPQLLQGRAWNVSPPVHNKTARSN